MTVVPERDALARAAEVLADPLAHPPRGERGCPPAEELVALAEGSLERAGREHVVDHLSGCPDCSAELASLRELTGWAREAAARLGERQPVASPWWALAAAGLGALVCGLSLGWLLWHDPAAEPVAAGSAPSLEVAARFAGERQARVAAERQLAAARERLETPWPNVPLIDLAPVGALRAIERSREVELPARGVPIVLVLSARAHAPAERYALRVYGPDGRELVRVEDLERSPYDTFTVGLPSGALAPGANRLELWALAAGIERLIERYELRLRAP